MVPRGSMVVCYGALVRFNANPTVDASTTCRPRIQSIDKVVGFEDTAPPQRYGLNWVMSLVKVVAVGTRPHLLFLGFHAVRLGIYARRLFDHWGIGYQKVGDTVFVRSCWFVAVTLVLLIGQPAGR